MIMFKNGQEKSVTNDMISSKLLDIEETGVDAYSIRLRHHNYRLVKICDSYVLTLDDNYEGAEVTLKTDGKNVEILSGINNGRKCKSDKTLKAFSQLGILVATLVDCGYVQ